MGVVQVKRPRPDLTIRTYLPEVLKGIGVTTRHFLINVLTQRQIVTRQYPEDRFQYAPRYRGHHRLMWRPDGSPRCVACFLCSTACPSDCIHIVAGEHENSSIEKYPKVFEIDLLKCVYCGFCEEACPCDAIRLDSGEHPAPGQSRRVHLCGKVDLLKRGAPSVSVQGGIYR